MIKKGVLAGFLFILCFFSFSFVSASFSYSSNISSINSYYGPGDVLSGYINLSISNENYNSPLQVFIGSKSYETSLKNFIITSLVGSGTNYYCTTQSCDAAYATNGSGYNSKTFDLDSGESKVIGFKVETPNFILAFYNFSLNIASDSQESCSNPLKIDLLDDNNVNWRVHSSSTNTCGNKNYGCYSSSSILSPYSIGTQEFCEKIALTGSTGGVRIGADVSGTSNGEFLLRLYEDTGDFRNCSASISGSGEVSCIINYNLEASKNFTVCIAARSGYENRYNLTYETIGTNCGSVGYGGGDTRDFSIFGQTLKYSAGSSYSINNSELLSKDLIDLENQDLESSISDHIAKVYGSNCSSGCIIPIKFTSYQDQTITLSSAGLKFDDGLVTLIPQLYDLTSQASVLSTKGYQKFDLSKLGFKVPATSGNYSLSLSLNSQNIVSKSINVADIPVLSSVYPTTVPAAIPVAIKVYYSGSNVSSFKWNFGDNKTAETTSNIVSHVYSNTGNYTLKVEIINNKGNSSKPFSIQVISPSSYIPLVITDRQSAITSIKSQIASLPLFVSQYFNAKYGIDSSEALLAKLKIDYNNSAGSTTKYLEVASALVNLTVPKLIQLTSSMSSKLFISRGAINIGDVGTITASSFESGKEEQDKTSILAWFGESLDVSILQNIYSAYLDGDADSSATRLIITINPLKELSDYYLIINAKKADIRFADSTVLSSAKEVGSSTYIKLADGSSQQKIEVLFQYPFNAIEAPVYFATKAENLPQGITDLEPCNYDGACQSSRGEDWKNCRSDCKPVGWVLFWLAMVLVVFFIVYIILQEWYKRNYENYLFKDKNDLFNLIHFINNAEKQKMTTNDLHAKLKEKGWDGEQITYAYKKYKGLRTGMFEIPVLKFLEKKQVTQEIEKRNKLGINSNLAPKPIIKFTPMPKVPAKPANIAEQQKLQQIRPVILQNNQKPVIPLSTQKPQQAKPLTPTSQNNQKTQQAKPVIPTNTQKPQQAKPLTPASQGNQKPAIPSNSQKPQQQKPADANKK